MSSPMGRIIPRKIWTIKAMFERPPTRKWFDLIPTSIQVRSQSGSVGHQKPIIFGLPQHNKPFMKNIGNKWCSSFHCQHVLCSSLFNCRSKPLLFFHGFKHQLYYQLLSYPSRPTARLFTPTWRVPIWSLNPNTFCFIMTFTVFQWPVDLWICSGPKANQPYLLRNWSFSNMLRLMNPHQTCLKVIKMCPSPNRLHHQFVMFVNP